MDEKIVVGSDNNYIQVFYEMTIRCNGCLFDWGESSFGNNVATHGNLIVTSGYKNYSLKLFIHTTEGELVKEIEVEESSVVFYKTEGELLDF